MIIALLVGSDSSIARDHRLGGGRIDGGEALHEAGATRGGAAASGRTPLPLRPPPTPLPTLQARIGEAEAVRDVLGDREALVLLLPVREEGVGGRASAAILATLAGVRVIPIDPNGDEEAIGRLIALASAGADAEGLARRLGVALLDPILAELPPRIDRLIVVAEGELLRLPFGALRLADGRRGDERVQFTFLPSPGDLARARRRARTTGETVVALGDPEVQRHRAIGDGAATLPGVRGVALPRLRHSADEARRVAALGRASHLLLAGAATERALRERAPDAAVLHLATHRVRTASGGEGLLLTTSPGDDGLLTPDELGALPMQGALVVLSACGTLAGGTAGTGGMGERSDGFVARALAGGASAVVATRWPVSDRETVAVMERFYRQLARGRRAAEALQLATRESRAQGVSIREWGAFALLGDGDWVMPAGARTQIGL